MEDEFDYVIVGAGPAGCVLAERPSRDPRKRLVLIEAGGEDRRPWIHIPKGVAKLALNPACPGRRRRAGDRAQLAFHDGGS